MTLSGRTGRSLGENGHKVYGFGFGEAGRPNSGRDVPLSPLVPAESSSAHPRSSSDRGKGRVVPVHVMEQPGPIPAGHELDEDARIADREIRL